MSQLVMRGHGGAQFKLNVVQFRSPMSASINTVQTRTMSHHFPIRAGQPDIQFTVQFRSVDDKHAFQNFVRDHQRNSQSADYTSTAETNDSGMVNLFWPQRGIVDWKGYIDSLSVREARFEYAPRITFGVMLVNSLLSVRTYTSSRGNDLMLSIISHAISPYVPLPDDLLRPPTAPYSDQRQNGTADQQQEQQNTGVAASPFSEWPGSTAP